MEDNRPIKTNDDPPPAHDMGEPSASQAKSKGIMDKRSTYAELTGQELCVS